MKVVACCVRPEAYQLIRTWAGDRGHELALVVTSPGPDQDRADDYRGIIAAAPPMQDIFVTTNMARLADAIRPLSADLLVTCTFPYRIPEQARALPRLGAFNLHPTPLPYYRGPNPSRMIYDGFPTVGACFHRMVHEFDAGPVLSRHESSLPDALTPITVWEAWQSTIIAAFYEGMAKAMEGDTGQPQRPAEQTRAARFSETERRLDWTLPGRSVLLRWIGLELFGPGAIASVGGDTYRVLQVDFRTATSNLPPPGTIASQSATGAEIAVHDGFVSMVLGELPK